MHSERIIIKKERSSIDLYRWCHRFQKQTVETKKYQFSTYRFSHFDASLTIAPRANG